MTEMTLNNFIPTTVMMSHEPKVVVVCGAMCDVAFVIQKTRMLHTKDNPDITYKTTRILHTKDHPEQQTNKDC